MCQKCKDDGIEYTHLSDLAIMLTQAFEAANGADLPIVVDDSAGDVYAKISGVTRNDEESVYRLRFEYSGPRYYGR